MPRREKKEEEEKEKGRSLIDGKEKGCERQGKERWMHESLQ